MIIENLHQIELELTSRCNARCPQCLRNYFGSYTWPSLPILDLDFDWFRSTISPQTWNTLDHVRLCGTYGDPCMHKDLLSIVSWIKENSTAKITINTNGGIRSKRWWQQLAKILNPLTDKVFFGIDGLEDTNHLYRIGVDYKKLIGNLKAFNDAGGQSIWSFLVFEHNQHQVEGAKLLSQKLGCASFVFKSTSRFVNKEHQLIDCTSVVDQQGKKIYTIHPATDDRYRNTGYDDFIQIEKIHNGYENYLQTAKISCKSKKQQSIYISVEGDVFPCGWLADRMYGYESEKHQDHQTLIKMIDSVGGREKINLHYSKLEDIIYNQWFGTIEKSWDTNQLHRCSLMCGDSSTLIEKANVDTINVWSGLATL